MSFEIKPYPEFSWSLSRYKSLMECQRKYAYEYYFSHNGWLKYNVDPMAQHTYRLKKLVSLPILFGQITHNIIESSIQEHLRSDYIPKPDELVVRAKHLLNQAYLDSRDRKKEWKQKPSKFTMLFDMYYEGELNGDDVQTYQHRIEDNYISFLQSNSFKDITTRKRHLKIDHAEEFRFLIIDNVKVFIVMDLLYRDLESGKWVIVDWKTGKESTDDIHQLALYAYYLTQKYNVSINDIELRNEYLLNGKQRTYKLSNIELESLLNIFRKSVNLMKRYQLDIISNEPLPIEEFNRTEYDEKCHYCKYKEICHI